MVANDNMNNNKNDKDNEKGDKSENGIRDNIKKINDTVTYYYNREERLKKLRNVSGTKHISFFKKGSKRTLLIILADVLIVSLFIYLISKPANLYEKKEIGKVQYELNISGIRGKRIMIALTIMNIGNTPLKIDKEESIVLQIFSKDKNIYNSKKKIGEDTILKSDESTSIVFMIKESELSKIGDVKVYIGDSDKATFATNVRFYYFNL